MKRENAAHDRSTVLDRSTSSSGLSPRYRLGDPPTEGPGRSQANAFAPARCAVSIVTVAELYDEAFNSPGPQGRLIDIRHFLSAYFRLPIDDGIAETFAETRTFLRRRGELINDFDLMIAATALSRELTLLTFNLRHFARIPDLKLHQIGA
jgi:tRNA(fMet)-specific endonuclease VapC